MDPATAALSAQFREFAGHHAPLYAALLTVLADDLDADGPTATICRAHLAAPRGEVVHLRLLAGLHRLVLRGAAPELAPWYADPAASPDLDAVRAVVGPLLEEHAAELGRGLDLPPQTNEVGRSACLAVGLFEAVRRHRLRRVRLLEPGASAGLNLNVDHYRVVGPGWAWGDPASPVVLDTRAAGVVPEDLVVVERRGCDLAPVDATARAGADHLTSFVWPSDRDRMRRLTAALEVVRRHPVAVDRAPASDWLAAQLAVPVEDDVLTVVWHSITRQYWPATESAEVDRLVEDARRRLPIAHVTMEGLPPAADIPLVIAEHGPELRVDRRLVARSHFHGPPVVLLGDRSTSSVPDHG
jgi:hypothetical protein